MEQQTKRPSILLTNDDGIHAPGLKALFEALSHLGDCTVIAPEGERSGTGHAITFNAPLMVSEAENDFKGCGWAVSGTPADCVKFGVKKVFMKKPHMIVSGINHGPNIAVDAHYSGTVAGAAEGGLMNIPSFAISLTSIDSEDFSNAAECAGLIAEKLIENGLPDYTFLNVNVPSVPREQIAGIRITRQGKTRYKEFYEQREDRMNGRYFWLRGDKIILEDSEDSDEVAIKKNYISVTPLQHDLTDYGALDFLRSWNFSKDN